MDITHITSLLGGIALFLYGMSIMGAGLEKLAGGKMQGVLQKLTSSTIKGVIFGTLITGVIQSSAGTVVICVGLVNSGIMTLTQSVGVIMGANIGTTVTGQLIRMADISGDSLWLTLIQPKTFAPVVAFIGCIFYVFLRNAKKKNIGQIMLGFGILFTGMSLMDSGVSPLRESAAFQDLFVSMTNPILGILVGVVATVIIQSSSASVGILQALSSTGLVTFGSHSRFRGIQSPGSQQDEAVHIVRQQHLGQGTLAGGFFHQQFHEPTDGFTVSRSRLHPESRLYLECTPHVVADAVEHIILRETDKHITAVRADGVHVYPAGRNQEEVARLVGMTLPLAAHRMGTESAASLQDIGHLKK